MRKMYLLTSLLWLVLLASAAHAAAPSTLNFQGYLKNADGTPVTTSVAVDFRLYDAPVGGNLLWTETITLSPNNGIFQTQLGKTQALSSQLFANQVYLGMQVGSDPEMSPRQPLLSVPHALRAAVADSVASGAVTTASLADGSVTPGKLVVSYVNKTGDDMTGALALPVDGLSVGGSQLVAMDGKVGIGTIPASRFSVLGGGWDLTNSEGDFRIGNGTYRLKMGVATGGGGAGDSYVRAHGGTGRLVLGSGTNNVLTVSGTAVGINTMTPTAMLTVGSPQSGAALSTTMATNAGSLGGNTGDLLKLANVGYMAGAYNVSLGLKALRTKTSTDWSGTAIGLLFDVDNVSPVNNAQLWLTADGRVGVGTPGPTEVLDVNGKGRFRGGLQVDSTAVVTNLNAEMIGGQRLADLDVRYGALPSQTGNAGKVLGTDGSKAGWVNVPGFGVGTNWAFEGHGRECTLGEVILTAGAVANGLPANGQLISISSNTALFSLLGTTYGGNGTTTFALPDLRSMAPNGLTYSICTTGIFPARN